jgi:hypothetical protein
VTAPQQNVAVFYTESPSIDAPTCRGEGASFSAKAVERLWPHGLAQAP